MKRIQDQENGPEQPASWVYGRHRLWSKAFLCFILLNFCIFMGFNILLPTMSLYLEKHGLSGGEIGIIYSTFMVSAIAMRTATGFLVSRRSPLPFIGLGLALCALASFGYYWSTTLYKGIFFRLLHGAGFGLTSTLITAMASQTIPQSRLGEGMSHLGLGTTIAMAAGPFLGIWLMREWGFMILFLGAGSCCVLAIGVLRLLSFFDPVCPVF
ncbi:MAG: MFS transporter, partial [Desulfovibrionaceae bacterium]|nr:MFS transporter [Desulfovibrionaceae bacterium]